MTDKHKPLLIIISGPNGAGKTTAVEHGMIPNDVPFINADIIARHIDEEYAESSKVAVSAGKMALKKIDEYIKENVTFAFETTLSGAALLSKIKDAHSNGYEVELIFFWLPSADAAIERVKKRVSEGGHNIPQDVIRRRYERGLERLKNFYLPYIDRWSVYDNSVFPPYLAVKKDDNGIGVYSGYVKIAIDEVFEKYDNTLDEHSKELLSKVEQAYKQMLEEKMELHEKVFTADSEGNLTLMDAAELYALHYGHLSNNPLD